MESGAVINAPLDQINEITCGNRSGITIHLKSDLASIRAHLHTYLALQAGATECGTNRLD